MKKDCLLKRVILWSLLVTGIITVVVVIHVKGVLAENVVILIPIVPRHLVILQVAVNVNAIVKDTDVMIDILHLVEVVVAALDAVLEIEKVRTAR